MKAIYTNALEPRTDATPEEAERIIQAARDLAAELPGSQEKRINEIILYYRQAAALLPLLPRFRAIIKNNGEEYANIKQSIKADGSEKSPNGGTHYIKNVNGISLGRYWFEESFNGGPSLVIWPERLPYEYRVNIDLYDTPNAYTPNGEHVPPFEYRSIVSTGYSKIYIYGSAKIEKRIKEEIARQEARKAEHLAELAALPAAVEFLKEEAERIKNKLREFGTNGREEWRENSIQYFIEYSIKEMYIHL